MARLTRFSLFFLAASAGFAQLGPINGAVSGGGTITSIATGCGLTGGPVTTSGTISNVGPCPSASVGGTADAITAVYSPVRAALFTGEMLSFTPTAPNATTTPTFSPDGLTAHTIVKAGSVVLAAGDIATGVAAVMKYDATGTVWELQNPQSTALGTPASGNATNLTNIPLANALSGSRIPIANLPIAAVTPNGPNVLYEYEVTGVSLLATGATTIFTTASGLGRFHATNASIEVTSVSGSTATGTLAGKFGTAGGDVDTAVAAGFSFGSSANACFAVSFVTTNCYMTFPVGLNNGTYDGGASIAAATAVRINITTALATATTVVATVRIWGFYE